jgi:hypothetical protein
MAIHASSAGGARKEILELLLPVVNELEEADPFRLLYEQTDPLVAPDYKQYVSPEKDVWLGLIRERASQGHYSSGAQLLNDVLQMQQNVVAYNSGSGCGMAANPYLVEVATALLQLATDRLKELGPQLACLHAQLTRDNKSIVNLANKPEPTRDIAALGVCNGPGCVAPTGVPLVAPSAPAPAAAAAAAADDAHASPSRSFRRPFEAAEAITTTTAAHAAAGGHGFSVPGHQISSGVNPGLPSVPLTAAAGADHGEVNAAGMLRNAKRRRETLISSGVQHQARTKADSPFVMLPASFAAEHKAELEALPKPAFVPLGVVVDGVPLEQPLTAKVKSRDAPGG